MIMKLPYLSFVAAGILFFSACDKQPAVDIYVTTDLHGMLLPFDNTDGVATNRSLANLATLVQQKGKQNVVLLDNGDILQGDPLVYYYNFVDTTGTHIVAEVLNSLGYDAATAGNHDIETGHKVYDKVRRQYEFPLLAANAIDISNGDPYFEPYTVINRNGFRIVVFGLITPSVPDWLPYSLYEGIRFDGMVETARKWMPVLLEEKPDLVVGLFHSGTGSTDDTGPTENSSMAVAVNVPGFDVIFAGHDHNTGKTMIANIEGDSVLLLDGGSRAYNIMHVRASKQIENGNSDPVILTGEVIQTNTIPESLSFISTYNDVMRKLQDYTSRVIGTSSASITTRDSYFGPSAFIDLIHVIQQNITGADVSFAAPLSFDESIESGEIRMRDMFRLYRFENFLYTIRMKGSEIDKYLEHSYGLWYNTMESKDDYLLKYRLDDEGNPLMYNDRPRLRNASYNFDSAYGVKYVVDVTKPEGSRITVISKADGTALFPDSLYTVAINSYRANGGGGHIEAAGISEEILEERLISSTDRDLRYYMTEWIEKTGVINPEIESSWSVIPHYWVTAAKDREIKLVFAEK